MRRPNKGVMRLLCTVLPLLLTPTCTACGAVSLPVLDVHAATSQRTRAVASGRPVDRRWQLLLYADLAFRVGRRPNAPAIISETVVAGLVSPPTATSDCTVSAACAWELTQVEDALAQLEPAELP